MIFEASAGSEGSDQEKFSIYIPFHFPINRKLSQEEKVLEIREQGYVVKVEKFKYHNAILVEGFNEENEAREFVPKIFASLLWCSLKRKISIGYPKRISDVGYFDQSLPVSEKSNFSGITQKKGWTELDGKYETHDILIIPERKKLIRFEMGQPSVIQGLNSENFVKELIGVWQHETPERILENKKLRTAIELYSRVDFESSIYAQFLTFVIILETITPSIDSSEICVQAIDSIIENINKTKDEYKSDTPEFLDLQGLAERIRYNKKQSFRSSISNFFAALAKENKKLGDEVEVRNTLKNIYDGRSRFVHNGKADEKKLIIWNNFLRKLIPEALEILYLREIGL